MQSLWSDESTLCRLPFSSMLSRDSKSDKRQEKEDERSVSETQEGERYLPLLLSSSF